MESRQGATRAPPPARKRSLEEVVAPAFVARKDEGGAYSMFETPKRFVHEYVADKGRVLTDEERAFELEEAQYTARRLRLIGFVDSVFRMMDAVDAARAAAAAEHSPSSPL